MHVVTGSNPVAPTNSLFQPYQWRNLNDLTVGIRLWWRTLARTCAENPPNPWAMQRCFFAFHRGSDDKYWVLRSTRDGRSLKRCHARIFTGRDCCGS